MLQEIMIKEIARAMNGRVKGNNQELARGVSFNSLNTKPGDVFFALPGTRTDGHKYVEAAGRMGAIASVVSQASGTSTEIMVNDTLYALGEFAKFYRRLFDPKTIAITGTNGKTTVKNLISKMLQRKYRVCYTKKNLNSLIGLPLTIFNLGPDHEILVVEIGTNHPGEIRRLCDICQPHFGVITNIGCGHLDGFGSIEGVREEKISLIDSLSRNGWAFLGEGVGEVTFPNAIRISLHDIKDLQVKETGTYFSHAGENYSTRLLGYSNAYNCLIALQVARHLAIDYYNRQAALDDIQPEPGRLEPLYHREFLIINDCYNANPTSMRTAIDLISHFDRRRVCVIGDMRELGKTETDIHREIGEYARTHCDILLTCGHLAVHYGGRHFKDHHSLINYLIKNLQGEEVILVKASRVLEFEKIVSELLRRI
ncbi:hypothetical protein A2Y85_00705 [candidate division WOR-3 bacterium RBG_13_43_14]|uniref:UDP-N-acetylmuramoyl-tripeptide--D-alanyl-D-alanine ligase n=1 Tax=candidate division WOR-3 bacterium RBG_13_43_14 TaxID=1802590 RepID=A0A1F4U8Q2_UNCW3|nr:MAG: hypothetical protein A2Y85_00705 [candidate division WOR-3 bacterium RBG_13_43_14]